MIDTDFIVSPFLELFDSLMMGRNLSIREKELIAIGIATTNHCDSCISLHIDNCINAGATPEEILEAAGVAVVMGGGPACSNVEKIAKILKRKNNARD